MTFDLLLKGGHLIDPANNIDAGLHPRFTHTPPGIPPTATPRELSTDNPATTQTGTPGGHNL